MLPLPLVYNEKDLLQIGVNDLSLSDDEGKDTAELARSGESFDLADLLSTASSKFGSPESHASFSSPP